MIEFLGNKLKNMISGESYNNGLQNTGEIYKKQSVLHTDHDHYQESNRQSA